MDVVCERFCRGCEETVLKADPPLLLSELRPFLQPLTTWGDTSPRVQHACLKALWAICVGTTMPEHTTQQQNEKDEEDEELDMLVDYFSQQLRVELSQQHQTVLLNCVSAITCRSPYARRKLAILNEAEAVDVLVEKLRLDQPPQLARPAAECLAALFLEPHARRKFTRDEGLAACLAQLRNGCANDLAESILNCLNVLLCEEHAVATEELQHLSAVPTLIKFISAHETKRVRKSLSSQAQALAVITLLAENSGLRQEIADARFFELAISMLNNAATAWENEDRSSRSSGFSLPAITGRASPKLPRRHHPHPHQQQQQQQSKRTPPVSPTKTTASVINAVDADDDTATQQRQSHDVVSATLLAIATVLLESDHVCLAFLSLEGLAVIVDLAQSIQGKMHLPEVSSVLLSLCEGGEHHQVIDQGGLEMLFQMVLADLDELSVSQACCCLRHLLSGREPVIALAEDNHFNLEGSLRHLSTNGGSSRSAAVKREAAEALKAFEKRMHRARNQGGGRIKQSTASKSSKSSTIASSARDVDEAARSARLQRLTDLVQSL
ncbi:hypothetical protein PTSG_04948 [Salpingoeca rosetta]|uniref:Uncharacterized protein n=1 Tax=Salpingoeca rosetta (strain ATCC 50818 / BSB-021) TaxID=946362 RepID=F2U929_SALR5|nr:uncharacterized protein PTSG_04948 [Salpingoeca rosetta]EGD73232.1 hypothetical protein PTSG_04948 [Salpingoeca rosetta]|eukprot:XP_004994263.1 hypothetical protein PTSG_04948 [Salpingoeca rosetta]